MKTVKESNIKDKVKKILNSYPLVTWYMPAASVYGRRGVGDFVCCVNGRYLEIETKRPGGKQTPLQKVREQDVEKSSGLYMLVSCDAALVVLKDLLEALLEALLGRFYIRKEPEMHKIKIDCKFEGEKIDE